MRQLSALSKSSLYPAVKDRPALERSESSNDSLPDSTALAEWRATWDMGRRELARRMSDIETCLAQLETASPRFPHLRIFPAHGLSVRNE